MEPKRVVLGIVFILVMALPALWCHGAVLTFTMEGPVQTVSDPLGLGFVQVGDHVAYTFTFDSTAPNGSYPPGSSGSYSGISATFVVVRCR